MDKGKIIILNGVSSVGKTTLAKALQDKLPQPYFHMDVDVFCLMAPDLERFYNSDDYSLQHNFASNMFDVVKMYSDRGFNLIVPCVFLEGYGFMEKCVTSLHSYPVLFTHVTCNLDELRRRERERGDRQIGSTESMFSALIPKDVYDITVDTFNFSTEECANIIAEKINSIDEFIAFKTLWSQMQS